MSQKDDPRAQTFIIDHLAPGTTIKRRIEVSNTTTTNASVSLYPTGATIKGGSFVGDNAGTADELAGWTTVGPGALSLAPGEMTMSTVTIAVPRDAAGEPLVTATVHNTGGRAIDLSGSLSLANGPGGLTAGPARTDRSSPS